MKERNCVDKYRSKCKKKRRGSHGYKAGKVTTTLGEEILAGRKFGGFGGFGENPPN